MELIVGGFVPSVRETVVMWIANDLRTAEKKMCKKTNVRFFSAFTYNDSFLYMSLTTQLQPNSKIVTKEAIFVKFTRTSTSSSDRPIFDVNYDTQAGSSWHLFLEN